MTVAVPHHLWPECPACGCAAPIHVQAFEDDQVVLDGECVCGDAVVASIPVPARIDWQWIAFAPAFKGNRS